MTLTPETRVLLTDALRPPAGFRVDTAVGTTYSLDLTALLLAPLSFAMYERVSAADLDASDPVRLLDAVSRYAERTTVFCQAGAIHVPASQTRLLTFIEDSVVQVAAPRDDAIFHPKVWALRFVNADGQYRHRGVILSRNITMDRSWDTALVLDEDPDGSIDAAPLAGFVRALPGLALRGVEDGRAADVASLADTLGAVRLDAPAPFSGGTLLPIGIDPEPVWPFPTGARRLLAISPFLTGAGLRALASTAPERTLVSRIESLELVGASALQGWEANVLQRVAEVDPGEDAAPATRTLREFTGTNDGLHAKTFVIDEGGPDSLVVTGSANLTSAQWGHNVEFGAALTGPTATCGVAQVLDGSDETLGLRQVLEHATVDAADGEPDPAIATSYSIERFQRSLAVGGLTFEVRQGDGDVAALTLTLSLPPELIGETTVWPASLPPDAHRVPLAESLTWSVATANVTPFVAVETTLGSGDAKVTSRCVIKAELTGDIADRRRNALASVLQTKDDVLRYLVFLLGDPAHDALLAELANAGGDNTWRNSARGSSVSVALFEPLVRATGRDEDALARIASAVADLREATDGVDRMPDGFEELWDMVWAVHEERRAR